MPTVVAPPLVTTRIAVLTGDEQSYHWLRSFLTSSPRGRYTTEWLSEAAALTSAVTGGEVDVVLWDDRVGDGSELAQVVTTERLRALPVVRLSGADADGSSEDFEVLPLSQLNAASLDRALRRARQVAELDDEVRRLRADRDAREAAQEQALHEHDRKERLLQTIVQSLPLLLGRIDAEGRVVETYGAGLTRCGIVPESLLNKRLAVVLPVAAQAVRQVLEGESTAFSVRGRHENAEWHADFVLLPEEGEKRGAIVLGRDVSERRWLEQQLLTATDAEQQRIGADLHDGLGQQLTGLACLVAALRDRLRTARQEELAAQADFVVQVANDATRQSRALARGLCPVQLEGATLQSALADLVHQAEQLHGITCCFRSRGPQLSLDHFTAIHLYHITQEALHNAVRHGSAGNVRVTLVSRGARHRLTIADNGSGFDSRQKPATASRGLRLMQYRAGMIGGNLSITSRPGCGTRVQCQFIPPIPPHEDQRRNPS